MKKFLLLTGLLVCAFISQAQFNEANEKTAASLLVNANKEKLGLSPDQLSNLIIQTSYLIQGSDIRMAYVQQGYKGMPVFNRLLVLAFRNGKVVSNEGQLLGSMEDRTAMNSGIPSVLAPEALRIALTDRKISFSEIPASVRSPQGSKLDFGKMGIAQENITAELMWLPAEDESSIKLVWQFFISPLRSSDMWLVHVDANTNQVVYVLNLTIYCNWQKTSHSIEDHLNKNHFDAADGERIKNFVIQQDRKTKQWQYRPFVENSGIYRVVRYPAESPIHPGGTPQIHTNPWTWAPGNATTLKWHSDGTTDFNDTKGNNVLAAEDADGNNIPGLLAVSSTALPDLTFDFTPDFTVHPAQTSPVPNQQFNITNLFYWNNLIHDVTYLYGFDEPSGNFQVNNLGRGGVGNDRVNADAQNPGNCNANFGTPADGTSPRMQMFLCTMSSPPHDGDVDNAVILHEYGHGISNRLTGGPTVVSCLGNSEQMGEGWSDFYGLMLTHDWATATPADGFNNPRGIGMYLFGQPANGPGIRPTRYCTNFAVNPTTYTNLPGQAVPHGVGYVWCTMLWEMVWEIIQTAGINPDIFNPTGGGGNAIALKLVQEGMRFQSCTPGFVQGRNAILRADTLFFGGQYSCAIWRAFARRGLGVSASQGLSTNITDGVANFDNVINLVLNENITAVPEGSNITFTSRINPPCSPITNNILRDTLPPSVTYVSSTGGTLAGNVVTFAPVNVLQGGTQSYSVTVNVNAGTLFVPSTFINDLAVALPPNWGTTPAPNDWTVSIAQSHTAPSSFFVSNPVGTSDKILTSTGSFLLNPGTASITFLSFWHFYNTQGNADGGVVEISTNGGASWTDAGFRATQNGYNSTLSTGSALAGRRAFSGNSGGFIQTKINLSSYAGQTIMIRFRFASNASVLGEGWYVDDILLENKPQVYVRSAIYNSTNVLIAVTDTLADIISGICVPPIITTHPLSVVRCSTPGNAVFSIANTGNGTYQWQVSSNGGVLWTNIPAATSNTYTIVNPTSALNGNLYRNIVTAICGADTSDAAVIHVSSALTHSAVSATPTSACAPGATDITGTASGGTTANAIVGSTGIINLAIPDNPSPGVTSSITLPALSFPAGNNLKLRLNIRHSWVGDLLVSLTSPCGSTLVFDRPGVPASVNGNSDNLGTNATATPPPGVYIFDLAGATIIPETTGGTGFIAPGSYQPSNTAGSSHTWTGLAFPCSSAGTWTLSIRDNAGGDLGMLVDWALLIGGNYTHSLSGPGTIVQNAPTGANNSTGNFSVTAIPAGVHTYTLTSTDILGCTVSSNISFTATTPAVITTQPVDRTICEGESTTFAVVVNSATPPSYQWQIDQGGGFIDLTTTPPFSGVATATLILTTPSTSYSGSLFRVRVSNACGTSFSNVVTLIVNPTPNVNAVPNQVLCNGASTLPINFSGSVPGTVYNWTNSAPSIGLAASGIGNIASFTATNNGAVPVVATITVTPTYTNGGATCTGTPRTFTITVNPSPTVNAIPDLTVCNGSATPVISFSGPVTGTVFYWTNNNTSIGLPASGTGNIASFTAINTGAVPVYANISVVGVFTNAGVTCFSTPRNFVISVNPTPTVNAVSNQSVCRGSLTTAVNFSGAAVPGVVFNWTNNTTSIGLAASGIGNIPAFIAVNNTALPVTATITVTPNYTQGGITCSGTPRTFTITVNPVQTLTMGSIQGKICLSDTLVSLVGLGLPVGGSWSGIGVSGFNFIPTATAVGTYTLTYSYTNAGGCTSTGTIIAKVEDCPERIRLLRDDAVILYPNPNNGRFNIRINSTLYNYLGMHVYSSTGQLIRENKYGGLVYGRVIPIDINNLPSGVYMVKFFYDDGIRTSQKTFKVVVGRD